MRIRKALLMVASGLLAAVATLLGLLLVGGCRLDLHQPAQAASHGGCSDCHGPPDLTWIRVARSPGHRAHAEAGTGCGECHPGDGHGHADLEWRCVECHFEGDASHPSYVASPLAEGHCTSCHSFEAERAPTKDMGAPACRVCHEERDVEAGAYPPDGPMKLPCYSCHEGHAGADKGGDCRRCHKDKHPGPSVTKAHTDCQGCHKPHTWSFTDMQTCLASDCHGSSEPGYDRAATLDVLALYRNGKRVRPYAHGIPGHNTCTACHRPHRWVVGPAQEPCRECHAKNKVNPHGPDWQREHPRQARDQLQSCSACHVSDEPGKLASFCTDCHGIELPHSEQFRHSREHGRLATQDTGLCAKCHSTNRVCARCHTGRNRPSSHGSAWRRQHPKAAAGNRTLCFLCHGGNACDRCHQTHMPHPSGWAAGGHKSAASFGPDSICFHCHPRSYCRVCHG